jgi:hypothetical protein
MATAYPAAATNAYWQKKKGLLDKAKKATKVTGLGELLKKAETEYNKIEFEYLEVGMAKGYKENPMRFNAPHEFDTAKQRAAQHILRVVRPARQAMRLAAAQAEEIAANKAKLYGKSTVAAATAVAKALHTREKQLANLHLRDFDEGKREKMEVARQVLELFDTNLNSALGKADVFIQKMRLKPQVATFNTKIQGITRGLTQNIGNVNKIKSQGAQLNKDQPDDLYQELVPWAAQGRKLDDNATSEEVLQVINQLERIVGDIRNWWA